MRKIIHIDMDAFFTSVEQRERPELRGKPVVVGGDPTRRGVVAGASYEARKFGVRSAMSCKMAHRLCPQAVFLPPNFKLYKEVSEQVHAIFHEVTDRVEPLSIDEAYLDVTENKLGEPLARNLAMLLKSRILEATGLTASAGVGPNKFIAKVASDFRKPNGLVVIPPQHVLEFVEKLPVEKLWGVGPATTKRLHELGLRTAADLRGCTAEFLEGQFGKFGLFLHDLSRGEDDRPVETDWDPKSRGSETTFEKDVMEFGVLRSVIEDQAEEVANDLRRIDRLARTVTLKLRYDDFTTLTRSQTVFRPTGRADEIAHIAVELMLQKTEAGRRPVRLIGVSVSGLSALDAPGQLWLDLPLF